MGTAAAGHGSFVWTGQRQGTAATVGAGGRGQRDGGRGQRDGGRGQRDGGRGQRDGGRGQHDGGRGQHDGGGREEWQGAGGATACEDGGDCGVHRAVAGLGGVRRRVQ